MGCTTVKRSVKRLQIPLVPAKARTVHNVQGQSFTQPVICDLAKPPRMAGKNATALRYVPLSRVVHGNNLYLLRDFDDRDLLIPLSEDRGAYFLGCVADEDSTCANYASFLQEVEDDMYARIISGLESQLPV